MCACMIWLPNITFHHALSLGLCIDTVHGGQQVIHPSGLLQVPAPIGGVPPSPTTGASIKGAGFGSHKVCLSMRFARAWFGGHR